MTELRRIPNVGKETEQDLIAMGYTTIESLKGKKADDLYAQECALRGCTIDRCQLYLYRAVAYFVNTENPDPTKCQWWHWKGLLVAIYGRRLLPRVRLLRERKAAIPLRSMPLASLHTFHKRPDHLG